MHRSQFVSITIEMFEQSWSNVDAIRKGITSAVCAVLGLYEISLGIVQSRGNVPISNFVILFINFH